MELQRFFGALGSTKNHASDARKPSHNSNRPRNCWLSTIFPQPARVFDAPRALVWKAWTDPQYVMQWWGPKGFTAPFCKIDFRVGGKFLCCMKSPDGQEGWNGGEYHEIVPHEKIVYSMY